MSFQIITDTSANLNQEILCNLGIRAVPLSYRINDEEQVCLAPDTMDLASFYDVLRSKVNVRTSLISLHHFIETFREYLQQGEDILYLGISSGISGSLQSAMVAADMLKEDFPERRIIIIDTLAAGLGEGLLVMRAARLREKGQGILEISRIINEERMQLCQLFTVDDLFFLHRGGRISGLKAVLGSVLHVKPLLKGSTEGKITVFGKSRGRRAAIKALVKNYCDNVVCPEEQTIAITHGDCLSDAEYLAEMIRESAPAKQIIIEYFEPVCGAHVGPGSLAVFFMGKER